MARWAKRGRNLSYSAPSSGRNHRSELEFAIDILVFFYGLSNILDSPFFKEFTHLLHGLQRAVTQI